MTNHPNRRGSIPECVVRLVQAGISEPDAYALRRIAMTLHRWHELECGDSGLLSSWAIERRESDGKSVMAFYPHDARPRHEREIPDREAGAKKRLGMIMAKYPSLSAYIQGDPRGAALCILHPGDVPAGEDVDAYYSRGIAVYK